MSPLVLLLAGVGGLLWFARQSGGHKKGPEQPASGLQGEPTQSTEQAGVHTYDVMRWPTQPDGKAYVFVKFKDSPGSNGLLFSEAPAPGPGGQVQRKVVQSFGPPEVVATMRGEWVVA